MYHGEAREPLRLDSAWEAYLTNAEGGELCEAWLGRDASLRFDHTYTGCHDQFRIADEAKVRTRLGDDSFWISLERPVRGWYTDEEVFDVDLPVHALVGIPETELQAGDWFDPPGGGVGFRLGSLRVMYGADG